MKIESSWKRPLTIITTSSTTVDQQFRGMSVLLNYSQFGLIFLRIITIIFRFVSGETVL